MNSSSNSLFLGWLLVNDGAVGLTRAQPSFFFLSFRTRRRFYAATLRGLLADLAWFFVRWICAHFDWWEVSVGFLGLFVRGLALIA